MEGLVNNIDLFMVLREELKSLASALADSKKLFDFLQSKINHTEENSVVLRNFCTRFCSNIRARWDKSSRNLAQFIKNNGDWLESSINWPKEISFDVFYSEQVELQVNDNIENLPPPPSTSEASTSTFTGRKPFENLCDRQKRRRLHEMNKSQPFSSDEAFAILTKCLKTSGNEDVSKIMNHLLNHPEDLNKVKACLNTNKVNSDNNMYSPDKALALLVSLKLSKFQYMNLRESACENGSELYPSYYKLKQAKLNCYPDKKDITITDDGASIKMQALLNLTVSRLLDAVSIDLDEPQNLVLVCKWGFDGASGQSMYKQKTNKEFVDSSVFMASLVPLRLQHSNGTVLWENERPSSTFYCRPIMFQFTKETQSTVMTIKTKITEEIEALQPSRVNEIEVSHQLLLTMIDGKITSYLSETSTSVCDVCKAKPSEMNNFQLLDQKCKNEEIYQYGVSSLHCWIRCMECLLHIAYRIDFKKWSSRGENQEKLKLRKAVIQQAFREDCGLLIDQVKQGDGTTNDGNTARRFFKDADTTARITGINKELIERLHVILQTIASGECLNLSKFSLFCRETAELYVRLYPWYYMPSSLHKLLIHGSDIIQHFGDMPIGKLSEEAAEARNKDFRKFRESFSRKLSRMATNEDILHNLLISSDPKITSLRPRMAKQNAMVLSPRVKELLLNLPTESEVEFININDLEDSHTDSD